MTSMIDPADPDGTRYPHDGTDVEEAVPVVRVLRLGPDDRLVLLLPPGAIPDPDPDSPVDPDAIREELLDRLAAQVAEWAGIDTDRVMVLGDGIDLTVVRPEGTPDEPC